MPTAKTDPLSATFSALADPTRRAILIRLADGPATVSELADPFRLSLPAISKHLKVLRLAGLLVQERDAQRRRCHLHPQRLEEVALWAERFRANWEQRYQRLDELLDRMTSQSREDTDDGDHDRHEH